MDKSIAKILDSLDNFNPTQTQLQAIQDRNFLLASQLGVTIDQYLYLIVNDYRYKLVY